MCHYLDFGDGFIGVQSYLNMSVTIFANDISIKLLTKRYTHKILKVEWDTWLSFAYLNICVHTKQHFVQINIHICDKHIRKNLLGEWELRDQYWYRREF